MVHVFDRHIWSLEWYNWTNILAGLIFTFKSLIPILGIESIFILFKTKFISVYVNIKFKCLKNDKIWFSISIQRAKRPGDGDPHFSLRRKSYRYIFVWIAQLWANSIGLIFGQESLPMLYNNINCILYL